MDWFLYDKDLRHERVKGNLNIFEQVLCQELHRSTELSRWMQLILCQYFKEMTHILFLMKILFIQPCGFRKGFITQCSMLHYQTTEKNEPIFRSRLNVSPTDLANTFDCLSRELLTEKFKCIGVRNFSHPFNL